MCRDSPASCPAPSVSGEGWAPPPRPTLCNSELYSYSPASRRLQQLRLPLPECAASPPNPSPSLRREVLPRKEECVFFPSISCLWRQSEAGSPVWLESPCRQVSLHEMLVVRLGFSLTSKRLALPAASKALHGVPRARLDQLPLCALLWPNRLLWSPLRRQVQ